MVSNFYIIAANYFYIIATNFPYLAANFYVMTTNVTLGQKLGLLIGLLVLDWT